jgi:6-phosphogluconolactonase
LAQCSIAGDDLDAFSHLVKRSLMIPGKRVAGLGVVAVLAGVLGCTNNLSGSGSSSHTAYVPVPTDNAVQGYRIDNHTGAFTTIVGSPFPAGISPASLVIHPSGKFAYAANESGNNISLFTIDSNTGVLSEVPPQTATGFTPVALAMNSGGTLLFAANEASSSIGVYTIDASSGALAEIVGSPFATNPNPNSVALTPSGNFLYVVNTNLSAIFAYTVASSGTLQAVSGSPFTVAAGPEAIAIDPGGKFAYVAESAANSVSVFSIDSTSGVLISVSGSPFAAGTSPLAVATDVSGKYLYVANLGSNNISEFSVNSTTGFLTPIADNSTPANPITSSIVASTSPSFLVADPNGTFFYAGSQAQRSVVEFTIDETTGVLTNNSQSAGTGVPPASMAVTK